MNPHFDSRFAEQLRKEIADALTQVHRDLGSGTVLRPDAAATGMNCAGYVGEIKGLKRALDLMEKVNDHMNGKGRKTANG